MERFGGVCPGSSKVRKRCRPIPCPVDGSWNNWNVWGICSVTCGGGTRSRSRTCNPPRHGGRPCNGQSAETSSCSFQGCPIDGRWVNWSIWGACSRSCGGGTKQRSRFCVHPRNNGRPCRGQSSETIACSTQSCPVNGSWRHWESWTSCSRTCGGGTKIRHRSCKGPRHGGRSCIGSTSQSRSCKTHSCPSSGGKCCLLGIFCSKLGPCIG